MSHPLVFGAFVPQGWKTDLEGIEGAVARWHRAVEIACSAEALGYDAVWVYDHVGEARLPGDAVVFECSTALAAMSQRTTRVRLGQMVPCHPHRQPSVVAKIAATLDVLSGGRLDFGLDARAHERASGGDSVGLTGSTAPAGMLEEAVDVVRALWTQPETTYEGRYFTTLAAHCDPKPLQVPHPPVWIGGGERQTLRVAARHADCANFGGDAAAWSRTAEVLRQQCREVGREYDAIRKTWSPGLVVRETEAEALAVASAAHRGAPVASWRAENLVGTPEQVAETVETYRALGCSGFVPWCADYPSDESLRLFAEKVMPHFR